jgi:hypothetical protein
MTSDYKIISSEEIMRKYYESGIEALLPTFQPVTKSYRNIRRRTEIYFNRKTRRKMLVRVFDERDDKTEEMCVTWLRDGDIIYIADRR